MEYTKISFSAYENLFAALMMRISLVLMAISSKYKTQGNDFIQAVTLGFSKISNQLLTTILLKAVSLPSVRRQIYIPAERFFLLISTL